MAEFAPIIVLALVGGALADAFDRRRLVQIAEVGAAIVAGALLVNATLPDPQLWVLYVCSGLMAAFTAVRRPPLDALMPRLVDRDGSRPTRRSRSASITSRRSAARRSAACSSPRAGLPATYAVDAATFLGSLGLLNAMRTPPPPADAVGPAWRAMREGLGYARSRQDLVGTYLVDMNAMFFGMPMALFPAIAAGYGGGKVLGLLYAAPSAGAVVVTLTSGWTRARAPSRARRRPRRGAWGVAIVGFGFANALWPALACLVLAGGMDAVSGIFRSAIWNETIPDRLRGRLAGMEMISLSSGPPLGTAEAGALAAVAGRPRLRRVRRPRVRRGRRRARPRAAALLALRQPR